MAYPLNCVLLHTPRKALWQGNTDGKVAPTGYRMVSVHPHDQWLLGISWNAYTYIDKALPFGLRSAPKILNAVADGLAWAMQDFSTHPLSG